MILLKEWSIVVSPEGTTHLRGFVFNHPKFADGSDIITSEVQSYIPEESLLKTTNNEYKLDEYTVCEVKL